MSIGDRIKVARLEKGYTQQELAEMIGVAKSTVTGYEKGNREPDAMKINALAKVLGVTGDYLLATEHVEKEVFSREAMTVARQYDKLSRDSKEFILMVINHEMQRPQTVETTQATEGERKRLSPEQLAERAEQQNKEAENTSHHG